MWLLTCCLEEVLIKALARGQLMIHQLAVGTVGCCNELTSLQVSALVFPVTASQNRVLCCQWLKIMFPRTIYGTLKQLSIDPLIPKAIYFKLVNKEIFLRPGSYLLSANICCDSAVSIVTTLRSGKSRVGRSNLSRGIDISLPSASRPSLGSIQSPIQQTLWVLSPAEKQQCMKLIMNLNLVPRLRSPEAVSLLFQLPYSEALD